MQTPRAGPVPWFSNPRLARDQVVSVTVLGPVRSRSHKLSTDPGPVLVAAVTAAVTKTKHEGGPEISGDRIIKNATKKSFVGSLVAATDCKTSSDDSLTSILPPKKKKNNKVQVSNTKKPFVFYLNLAKRYLKLYNDVELSALGMAIPTVVTIAEILKRNGKATEKRIAISTVISSMEDEKGRQIEKAKIEIVLQKVQKLDNTSAAVASVPKESEKEATTGLAA